MSSEPEPGNTQVPPKELISGDEAQLLQAQIDYLSSTIKLMPNSYDSEKKLFLQLLVNSANNTLNDMTCLNFIGRSKK